MEVEMNAAAEARSVRWKLFATTFGILALELAVIRWMSQQIRVFAYLNNVLLMASFFGMGLGVALGRRRPGLVHLTLPATVVLSLVLTFSEPLRLLHLGFPDGAVAMWGVYQAKSFGASLASILLLFSGVSAVFLFAGAAVGDCFARLKALDAYSVDLLGSLAGVAAITLLSAFALSPPYWFLLAVLAFIFVSRRVSTLVAGVLVLLIVSMSVRGAVFSPYYRIDIDRAGQITGAPLRLSVNRDFHQYMHDLSFKRISSAELPLREKRGLGFAEQAYRLPFMLAPQKGSALVVGGGTGNDVAAALRDGYQHVTSVDIDPVIVKIGRDLHPEQPYSDRRVDVVINDARAFFEQSERKFDVVCFGLLDSHAMFSAMASLRLDNYVYTEEALSSAWEHVAEGGVMSLSFSIGDRQWLADRLAGAMYAATGVQPIVVLHGVQGGRSFIVGRNLDVRARARAAGVKFAEVPLNEKVRVTSDDWPFLYVKPDTFPTGYVAVLAGIFLLTIVGTRLVYGSALFSRGGFDLPLFLIGAAFLLIETRGITDLSLLFGSTWIVNSAVFAGILMVAWMSNSAVRRGVTVSLPLLFAILAGTLVVNYIVRPSMLLDMPLLARGILGGLVNALPVGVAGLIFSTLLARSTSPDLALGSNLIGTVVGGSVEYLSMFTGLRALTLIAFCFYAAAFLIWSRRSRAAS